MLRSAVLAASATAIMVPAMVAGASAQRLLEKEGIELRGTARVVTYAAGKCNVLEASHTEAEYGRIKANHGQPLHVWQLDFSVHNGSGKWLDHLIARYGIESRWPDCTNWSGPSGTYPEPVQWASTLGHIRRGGRNVVAPGSTLTATTFILALDEDQPRFENWSVDFTFGESSSASDAPLQIFAPPAGSPSHPPAEGGSSRALVIDASRLGSTPRSRPVRGWRKALPAGGNWRAIQAVACGSATTTQNGQVGRGQGVASTA